jgi:SAM-dependent methyltransferase
MQSTSKIPKDFSPNLFHPFYFIRRGLKNSIELFSPYLTGRLMDFGCGSKPYKSMFQVEEYIGVDFHNEGHPHDNEQIDVFYDGEKLPFENSYFDSVLCSEVFEHVFNLDEVLTEINRVMKPGGMILITCPFSWNEHEVPHDYARYTFYALKHILGKNGFEVVQFRKAGNFMTTISQLFVLYFHTVFYKKTKSFFLLRWIYKLFLVFIPNCVGIVLNKIFPSNSTLYLNNIVLAKKKGL